MKDLKINRTLIEESIRTVKRPRNTSIIKRYEEDEEAPQNSESEYIQYVTPAHYKFQVTCGSMKDWDEVEIEGITFVMYPNGILHQKSKFKNSGELSCLEEDGLSVIEKLYELR
jgi:hypothetical protein